MSKKSGDSKKKQDRRIKRTLRMLSSALITLTMEKGYEAVSIRDITEKADIGYTTFFRHYKSKDALLRALLDDLLAEAVDALPLGASMSESEHLGQVLFEFVEARWELFNVILGKQGSHEAYYTLQELGCSLTRSMLEEDFTSELPIDIVAHHLISSVLSLIQWWIDNNKPYTPEQMGKMYVDLIVGPLHTSTLTRNEPLPND